jgi:hypothetical protein
MSPRISLDSPSIPDTRHAKPSAVRAKFGRHIFALGIMAIGLTGLVWGNFITGQTVPNDFPHRTALAYIAASFLVFAGILLQWRRSASVGAAALATYYIFIVLLLMNGPLLLSHYGEYGTYEGLSQQCAIAAVALLIFARFTSITATLEARLTLIAQFVFGLCALIWGGAHFVYMDLTAPLIPQWLPPSQVFWGYLTGLAFIAAGLSNMLRIKARLAAILLTAMLASFTLLVHVRILFTNHKIPFNWTELAINFTLLGAAWIVADSFSNSNPQAGLVYVRKRLER